MKSLLLVVLVLAPSATAHWHLRHADHPDPRSGPGDGFALAGGTAQWRVVSPALEVFEGRGASLALPPGRIVNGTWLVLAEAASCGPGPWGLSWSMAARGSAFGATDCGSLAWVFNWYPNAIPPGDGSGLRWGPGASMTDLRELQEPTFYQDLTPYYNLDFEDDFTAEYELLAGNSHPVSEASTPTADDDGDGIPDRGDRDAWAEVWLRRWAGHHGIPWPLPVPRLDDDAEDAERALAREHPELAPYLQERVEAAPRVVATGAAAAFTFRVFNQNGSEATRPLVVVPRSFRDAIIDVPRSGAGTPLVRIDAAATAAALDPAWQVAVWDEGGAQRALFQTREALVAVLPGTWVDLPVVAQAADAPGAGAWAVTVLYGATAPERRFAFPDVGVVS